MVISSQQLVMANGSTEVAVVGFLVLVVVVAGVGDGFIGVPFGRWRVRGDTRCHFVEIFLCRECL